MGLGMIFSWTSPSLPHLTSSASTYPVSEIQGALIASIVGCGTISGFLINPILINKLGSKRTLLFLSAPEILSWCIIYFCRNWLLLCLARIIGGFGYGAGLCSTAIYLSEIGDKRTRGIFLTLIKMSINIGIFISMFLGAFLSYDTMNLVLMTIPIVFVVTFYSMPDVEEFKDEIVENNFTKIKDDFKECENSSRGNLKKNCDPKKDLADFGQSPNGFRENADGSKNNSKEFHELSVELKKDSNGFKKFESRKNHQNDFTEIDNEANASGCKSSNVLKTTNSTEDVNTSNEILQETKIKDNKVMDVVKEDTVIVLQNNTIVLVNDDTVDVIESRTIDFLNENISCLNENLPTNSEYTQISPKEKRNEDAATENASKIETFEEEILHLLDSSSSSSKRKSSKNIWWKLFFLKNNRNALLIIIVASLTDIFSGHMAIVTYTQQIFQYSGASLKPEYAALILAVLKIIASLISTIVVENVGRRNLFLTTGILAGLSQGLVGLFFFLKFYLKMEIPKISWLPLLGVSMYEVIGSVGLSSLYYVYQGELFSDEVKGLGVTLTNISYEVITFFIKLYFQIVIDTIGIYSVFFGFGICCIIGSCLVFWISPETKGKSKEEIQILLSS